MAKVRYNNEKGKTPVLFLPGHGAAVFVKNVLFAAFVNKNIILFPNACLPPR